jgi:type IV secretion system protein VirD4
MKQENYRFGRYIKNDNSSRWADSDEIKNTSTIKRINIDSDNCSAAGIPVISDGRVVYVDNSDTHSLIFGSTGSKKTRLFGMPLINILALGGESFITTDPKGELFDKTSGLVAAKGYKIYVLNFRDLRKSDYWNPLMQPYVLYHSGKTDEAVSLINDFINTIAEPQRSNTKDIYFIELACSQILANMLFFIATASPEEVSIFNFANFFMANSTPDKTERLANFTAEGSIASINYKSILTNKAVERTFANVTSCVAAMLNPFIIRRTLCQVLSQCSFDIRSIGNTKTAVYVIIPDEKTTLHYLVTIFIKQTYETLINEAHQMGKMKLPVRVNFVLDEFCNIPAIPDMPSMISAARSRNMRFFLMAQSLWQLRQKYKDDANTIKANCDNWVFLTSRDLDLLQEISNLCGDTIYKDSDDTAKSRPLISISELQRLKKEFGETLILHGRNYPFVTELPDINEYKFNIYPQIKRDERQLPQIPRYNVDKVIGSILGKKIPIPFSFEVFGKEVYADDSYAKVENKDTTDW